MKEQMKQFCVLISFFSGIMFRSDFWVSNVQSIIFFPTSPLTLRLPAAHTILKDNLSVELSLNLHLKSKTQELEVVTHIYNPRTQETEWEDSEFEASLDHIMSSRPALAAQGELSQKEIRKGGRKQGQRREKGGERWECWGWGRKLKVERREEKAKNRE